MPSGLGLVGCHRKRKGLRLVLFSQIPKKTHAKELEGVDDAKGFKGRAQRKKDVNFSPRRSNTSTSTASGGVAKTVKIHLFRKMLTWHGYCGNYRYPSTQSTSI